MLTGLERNSYFINNPSYYCCDIETRMQETCMNDQDDNDNKEKTIFALC